MIKKNEYDILARLCTWKNNNVFYPDFAYIQ